MNGAQALIRTLVAAGRRFRATGDLDAAAQVFSRAHSLDPTSARPLVERGAILILQHRYDETLANYRRAEQLDPNYPGLQSYFAELFLYTGSPRNGGAAMGSWITYGLGSENQNLPGFVVLISGGTDPTGGKALWSTGYLPSVFQGVQCRTVGDPINIKGPKGKFLLQEDGRRCLFVSSGTGLAPFISMIETLRGRGRARDIVVLHGVSHPYDLAWRDELMELQASGGFPLRYVGTISRPQSSPDWTGCTGRV